MPESDAGEELTFMFLSDGDVLVRWYEGVHCLREVFIDASVWASVVASADSMGSGPSWQESRLQRELLAITHALK